ncbi:MAG: alkaline phosphatase family protein, partial [Ferruginibacter sp.]
VNMKNMYKISYPGYNEILTGYADPHFIPNSPVNNKNINLLEYFNQQTGFAGRVAAFTSWNIFPYILNQTRNKLPVNSGYEALEADTGSVNDLINQVQETVVEKKHTRHDLLTYLGAKEYIQAKHPKILFLGMGETDESAHGCRYDAYLQQAAMFDKMIAELWYYVQTDPFYKDNTTFIITTDHGRGSKSFNWNKHSLLTRGSGQTWLAMIGAGIVPSGEMTARQQIFGNQLVATMAGLLGEKFETSHPVGVPINLSTSGIDNPALSLNR